VVRQGDPGGTIYFVTEGQVEVRLYVQSDQPAQDADSKPHIRSEGSFTTTAAVKQPLKRSSLNPESRLIPDQYLQNGTQALTVSMSNSLWRS
jgi:hypothetical protein